MAENGTGPAAAQAGGESPPLVVKGQYIKDLSFENPAAPAVFEMMSVQPNVDINVNVEVKKLGGSDYEVTLAVRVDAKSQGKQIFLSELAYAGVFMLGPQIPEDQQAPVLLIECPRLLFPFARAIIADMTRDGGFPPMVLQPIDFVQLYQQQMAQQGQPAAKA